MLNLFKEQKYDLVLKIAENIKHGESVYRNSKRYGVSETTIKGWLLPYRIEKFKQEAEHAARRNLIKKKHCGESKDSLSLSDVYRAEFYRYAIQYTIQLISFSEIIAEILALEEETGSLTPQDEADVILSEIRSSVKYKKYKQEPPPKNKYEKSWLSVRCPFGRKLHEARNGDNEFL